MIKEYIPLKIPDYLAPSYAFNLARKGKQLEAFGRVYKLERRRFLFIKEPAFLYKIRLRNHGIINYRYKDLKEDLIHG